MKLASISLIAALVIGFLGVFSSYYTIDEGERGVVLRTGKIIATAEPGLNFKIPFVDSVRKIEVRDYVRTYESVLAYSKDQQTATMRVTANFRVPVDRVTEIYSKYGSIDAMVARVLDPQVQEELKAVFGSFNAVTAIQERGRLGAEAQEAILAGISGPITVDSIQIENIDFSDVYEQSIEQRMLAEVEVQKVRQNAEREKVTAEITVTQAKAQAAARLAQATAEAEATRLRGDAEASAIRARAEALRNNPALVELTKAERWNGTLPTSMVPGTAVPFLDVSPLSGS